MIAPPASTIASPHSVTSFGGCSEQDTEMNCIVEFLNWVLRGQSLQSVLVYIFTYMHTTSYSCDFFASSCRVNV